MSSRIAPAVLTLAALTLAVAFLLTAAQAQAPVTSKVASAPTGASGSGAVVVRTRTNNVGSAIAMCPGNLIVTGGGSSSGVGYVIASYPVDAAGAEAQTGAHAKGWRVVNSLANNHATAWAICAP